MHRKTTIKIYEKCWNYLCDMFEWGFLARRAAKLRNVMKYDFWNFTYSLESEKNLADR
jgi:hypothetical protein